MHLIRPPQRLHRQMPPARPVSKLSSDLARELDLATAPADGTPRGFMDRILTCDRMAWEAAERCADLRREQSALLHAQASNSDCEVASSPRPGLMAEILNAQLERNRERLECAELSYRGATQLLRETITAALAERMAPPALTRAVETVDEPEATGSGVG